MISQGRMVRATRFKKGKHVPKNRAGRQVGSKNLLTLEEKRAQLQPIQPELDYNQVQLSLMTGVSLRRLRQLMAAGLPSRMIGYTRFILGSDWIDWTRKNIDSNGNIKKTATTSATTSAVATTSAGAGSKAKR